MESMEFSVASFLLVVVNQSEDAPLWCSVGMIMLESDKGLQPLSPKRSRSLQTGLLENGPLFLSEAWVTLSLVQKSPVLWRGDGARTPRRGVDVVAPFLSVYPLC